MTDTITTPDTTPDAHPDHGCRVIRRGQRDGFATAR